MSATQAATIRRDASIRHISTERVDDKLASLHEVGYGARWHLILTRRPDGKFISPPKASCQYFFGTLRNPEALRLFLNLHFYGFVVAKIFSGLWLLPLALLVFRSRFLPRFLGVWLALVGFAWAILSLTGVLSLQYYGEFRNFSGRIGRNQTAFPSSRDSFRAVLAVKGSLRRA